MKVRFAAAALVSASAGIAQAAAPMAAWERASKLVCDSAEGRLCVGRETTCTVTRVGVSYDIDFTANILHSITAHGDHETIVWKRFKSFRGVPGVSDIHVAHFSGGGRTIHFGQPSGKGPDGHLIPAVFISSTLDEVRTFFLKCKPQ